MLVSWTSFRSKKIHFLFFGVFFSVTVISHFAPHPEFTSPPLSPKPAHPKGYALEAKDNDLGTEKDHEFVNLHAVRIFIAFPFNDWHLHTNPNAFIKSVEKFSLPPRSPPVQRFNSP